MWQLYALGAMVFNAAEEAVDKIVVVSDLAIDTIAATFYRNFIYLLLAVIIGLTGVVGSLTFVISWPIVLVGLLAIGSAVFYTYLLKHVELTGSSGLGYLRPAIFLLVDITILRAPFSGSEILGVVLLILGGAMFVINPLTRRLKPEYTKFVWLIFIYETVSYAAEYYVFKHYFDTHNLNEISYVFSTYVVVVLGLLILAIWKGSKRNFIATATHHHYLRKITLSKGLDILATLLWYRAATMATVSQVSAIEAFYPLILLVMLYVIQKDFKFKVGERFDHKNLALKSLATVVLVIGAWLAS